MLRGHTFRSLNHAHDHFFGGMDYVETSQHAEKSMTHKVADLMVTRRQRECRRDQPPITLSREPFPSTRLHLPNILHPVPNGATRWRPNLRHAHTLLNYAEDPGRAGAIVPMILVSLASVHDITGLLLMGFRVG